MVRTCLTNLSEFGSLERFASNKLSANDVRLHRLWLEVGLF